MKPERQNANYFIPTFQVFMKYEETDFDMKFPIKGRGWILFDLREGS